MRILFLFILPEFLIDLVHAVTIQRSKVLGHQAALGSHYAVREGVQIFFGYTILMQGLLGQNLHLWSKKKTGSWQRKLPWDISFYDSYYHCASQLRE